MHTNLDCLVDERFLSNNIFSCLEIENVSFNNVQNEDSLEIYPVKHRKLSSCRLGKDKSISNKRMNCEFSAGVSNHVIKSRSRIKASRLIKRKNDFNTLSGMTLNVSNLSDKLKYGIIDEYFSKVDVVTFVETKIDSPEPFLKDTFLQDHKCFSKQKPLKKVSYMYGGIHGISVLFSPKLMSNSVLVEVIGETRSECVLWVLVKLKNGFNFIMGAVYIPGDQRTDFKNVNVFDDIETDVLDLKVRYSFPMFMSGDWNSHTKTKNDYLLSDDILAEETGCDILNNANHLGLEVSPGFTLHRYSTDDMPVNRNGNNFISFLISLGFKIVNGRLGADKYVGQPTCFKSLEPSVIDYLIVCDDMLKFISDFKVNMFDNCMSDVHAPIEFMIEMTNQCNDLSDSSSEMFNLDVNEDIPQNYLENCNSKFVWSKTETNEFKNKIENIDLTQLEGQLNCVKNKPCQENVDNLCDDLNDILINVAKESGAFVERKQRTIKPNLRLKSKMRKPWEDSELSTKRIEYYKIKNKLKRKGEKSMCNVKAKEFKRYVKQKELSYFKDLNQKIRHLRSNNSKGYWNLLNNSVKGKTERASFCMKTFMEHFKKLNETCCENVHFDENVVSDNSVNEKLNVLFSVDDIVKAVNKLKNGKSAGIDLVHNEFLKNSNDQLFKFYCKLFNTVLETGIVPNVWCKGLIMPLYKNKGSKTDPDNYRGITLLSCLGKLFTACLNQRISEYIHSNQLGLEQAGFRKGFSTMDHVFTLHSIINYYQNKNGRVYCAFIDYRKAFDFIDRSSLWLKLVQNNVNGKVLNVIKNMYSNAKSCLKSSDGLSKFFSCGQGVRQGENLSPILFAIYLNDFNDFIASKSIGLDELNLHINTDPELDVYVRLYVLLYADDTIIMAETEQDLQTSLNSLNEYCKKWSLEVNLTKTKVVIFSKGIVKKCNPFYFDGKIVDIVSDYTYLGVIFNQNGSFRKAIDKQIAQAKKAMYSILQKAKILKLPIDIVCQLYEACVIPVLLYGCEIWGFENLESLEIFHRRFFRIILNYYQFSPNCMLYGETNSVNIVTKVYIRMVNYWFKLSKCEVPKLSCFINKKFMKDMNDSSSNEVEEVDKINYKWHKHIKFILDGAGFSYVWLSAKNVSDNFKSEFKQRCHDIFIQNWKNDMHSNSQCRVYKLFKEQPKVENFMLNLDYVHRLRLSKFISRVHNLPVTLNRFDFKENDPITLCPLCDYCVTGDESHYLFVCPYFSNERKRFIPDLVHHQNMSNLWKMLFNLNMQSLANVSKFIKIILNYFDSNISYEKPDKFNKSDIYVLKTTKTKCGRNVIKPSRYR